jgi:hypothetical protein
MHMAAVILRHRTRRDRLRAAEAEELRRLVGERPGLPERLRSGLIAAIDRETASENGWTFVMLSPEQNRAVLDWLLAHSSRPRQAVALWARLLSTCAATRARSRSLATSSRKSSAWRHLTSRG